MLPLWKKIAHMTNGAKNRLHDKAKNRPQDRLKNRPDIIKPVSLCGVVDEVSLEALLRSERQGAWCSRVRLCGLLFLIDYICRNLKNGLISISADLEYCEIIADKLKNAGMSQRLIRTGERSGLQTRSRRRKAIRCACG
jgi:hypothetical protein